MKIVIAFKCLILHSSGSMIWVLHSFILQILCTLYFFWEISYKNLAPFYRPNFSSLNVMDTLHFWRIFLLYTLIWHHRIANLRCFCFSSFAVFFTVFFMYHIFGDCCGQCSLDFSWPILTPFVFCSGTILAMLTCCLFLGLFFVDIEIRYYLTTEKQFVTFFMTK